MQKGAAIRNEAIGHLVQSLGLELVRKKVHYSVDKPRPRIAELSILLARRHGYTYAPTKTVCISRRKVSMVRHLRW